MVVAMSVDGEVGGEVVLVSLSGLVCSGVVSLELVSLLLFLGC